MPRSKVIKTYKSTFGLKVYDSELKQYVVDEVLDYDIKVKFRDKKGWSKGYVLSCEPAHRKQGNGGERILKRCDEPNLNDMRYALEHVTENLKKLMSDVQLVRAKKINDKQFVEFRDCFYSIYRVQVFNEYAHDKLKNIFIELKDYEPFLKGKTDVNIVKIENKLTEFLNSEQLIQVIMEHSES